MATELERQRNDHEYSADARPDGISSRLLAARHWRGFTLRRLAAATGISRQGLHNYETGLTVPTPERIAAIAAALRVPAGQLMAVNILQSAEGGGGESSASRHEGKPDRRGRLCERLAYLSDARLVTISEIVDAFIAAENAEPAATPADAAAKRCPGDAPPGKQNHE